MRGKRMVLLIVLLSGMTFIPMENAVGGNDDDDGGQFEVVVTNLTRGQRFTPILVASHRKDVKLFELGEAASPELATVAEEGNTGPLKAKLEADPRVLDVEVGPGLLQPGESRTITVETRGLFDHLSVVAMLIPTNDGFFAANGVKGGRSIVIFSPAYDAGSEVNDELCESIPGPSFSECGGDGGGVEVTGGEEGYVHISPGIHGIGDFDAPTRDWRNPVARIVIRKK